ncbi:hypothetical protein H2198_002753 [Neophaeococcomyces mojaviensis]|uniref:Uncharacterized protein n=1 Tax=Neophaeococcomyces mojaviensis TaxID=3383035 RepID=A0ACC3AD99_9EURO|nr:hypothetical protein H2198_002753 [Knufia sp. JES_112]
METPTRSTPPALLPFQHDPDYLTLSRMLARYQNLILLTPTPDESLDTRLAPWQKKIQAELWSPLPFHRMKWLRSIEGARTLLLKLEQSAQGIKVQRTKREVVKDLAEKRMIIKRLRSRVEEIGREVENGGRSGHEPRYVEDDAEEETMYDVLQQLRASKRQKTEQASDVVSQEDESIQAASQKSIPNPENEEKERHQLFSSSTTTRRRQGKSSEDDQAHQSKTSGFSNLRETEESLLKSSREHEDITTSLVSMAVQLKQQAKQFQFTLEQDKGLLDRALEGLDQNVSAMGLASKGVKTLQRMSEEQGFWGRLKLQLLIGGMWLLVVMFVFIGPKLRF